MKTKNKIAVRKIKIMLWDKDLNVSKLARIIGRSRPWTSQVLYGHAKSKSTMQAIANILGIKVKDIWKKK